MLLLTEGPHLFYGEPDSMQFKGEIPFTAELRTEVKNFSTFFVHTVRPFKLVRISYLFFLFEYFDLFQMFSLRIHFHWYMPLRWNWVFICKWLKSQKYSRFFIFKIFFAMLSFFGIFSLEGFVSAENSINFLGGWFIDTTDFDRVFFDSLADSLAHELNFAMYYSSQIFSLAGPTIYSIRYAMPICGLSLLRRSRRDTSRRPHHHRPPALPSRKRKR